MIVRPPVYSEIEKCEHLALLNWGNDAADRCRAQMIEHFKGGPYAPQFVVADIGSGIAGFAAYAPSMLMPGVYDFIWIAVHAAYQGKYIGHALTEYRLSEVRARDGAAVILSTQKPRFFAKFGFVPVATLGDGWFIMLKRLRSADMKGTPYAGQDRSTRDA